MGEQETVACHCGSLPDLAAVPMGGDGLDERVFETLDIVTNHGGDQWWLYLSKCGVCNQNWMVAQEERIFDEYFMRRVDQNEASEILNSRWPIDFLTYEQVLKAGHKMGITPCRFFDPLASSLEWSVEDLRKERPEISTVEIAELLGIPPSDVELLSGENSDWFRRGLSKLKNLPRFFLLR